VPSKRARPDGASWSWRRRDVCSGRFKGRPGLVVCRSVRSCNGGYDGNYTVLPGFCQGNFGNSCSLHAGGEHGLGSPVWQGLPGQPHFCSLQTGGHDGLWSPVSLQPATHVWLKSVHNYCLQGSKKRLFAGLPHSACCKVLVWTCMFLVGRVAYSGSVIHCDYYTLFCLASLVAAAGRFPSCATGLGQHMTTRTLPSRLA
jgi:hypothetical protein